MSDWAFRDDGTLEAGPIMLAIFSPSSFHSEGSPLVDIDFSTERNYGLLCGKCQSKSFTEVAHAIQCRVCRTVIAVRAVEEHLH